MENSYLSINKRFSRDLNNLNSCEEESYFRKLTEFFKPLIFKYRVAKEIKRQTDKFLASDFNLVEIINPTEEKISDIIAMLLRPDGEHGQGNIFLRKFLEILSKELPEKPDGISDIEYLLNCRIIVDREVEAKGRLDIRIYFKKEGENFFTIGIENKPWAGDQPEQLKRYSDYLEKDSDHLKEKYVLLFISGDGRMPSEFSISEKDRKKLEESGNLLCSSYHKFLILWLKECLKECEAEKVRWFLRDFITWIRKNFREEVSNGSEERGYY